MTALLPPSTSNLDHSDQPDERPSVDGVIAAWLDAKKNRSGSRKTEAAYTDTIHTFRAQVLQFGHDLDGDPRIIALAAQGWAGRGHPAPATFNQRLAILSSFFTYAQKHHLVSGNPIAVVERRKVQTYANAVPLNYAQVKRRLKAIDRTMPIGARDYALLAIALQTGRRLSELANLRWGDVHIEAGVVTLTFRRAKGGKVMRDSLQRAVGAALLGWLQMFYKSDLGHLANVDPLWVSLSPNRYGQPLGIQSIADMCERHFGTSKVHALRHTFARAMEETGAKVSDIQARLGHESLQTTGKYLAALKSAENPQADALAELFGIDDE